MRKRAWPAPLGFVVSVPTGTSRIVITYVVRGSRFHTDTTSVPSSCPRLRRVTKVARPPVSSLAPTGARHCFVRPDGLAPDGAAAKKTSATSAIHTRLRVLPPCRRYMLVLLSGCSLRGPDARTLPRRLLPRSRGDLCRRP